MKVQKRKLSGLGTIRINKYMIIFLFVFFLFSIGASYAYFAYQTENDSVIAGNIISIDAELTVNRIVGTNENMVPLINEALPNAINGTGSGTPCVDSQGNLSCQVYKISLINKGSRLKNVKGTIELYAQTGTGNVYQNLKWRELTDTTTVKDGSVINGMEKSVLVNNLTVQSKETLTWYIAVWISEIDGDQRNTDKGEFGGTVTFEAVSKTSTDFIEETLEQQATLDTDIDFTAISSDTNGKGIYLRSGTENNTYPIYYYRGEADNNLIFAGFCWKIVRTTETGGLKLIYNGTPSGNTCNNTGTSSQISTKPFNTNYNSPAYVGYKYGTPYLAAQNSISSTTTIAVGNDVTYSNGQYTLTNTKSDTWGNLYNGGLDNHHYTCFTTGTTCTTGAVYYITASDTDYVYYLTLTGGKRIESAIDAMLDYNTTSSTIKGNGSTTGTLEGWYATNIAPSYSSYIEDTVWCNDRSLALEGFFNPNGGTTNVDEQNNNMDFPIFTSAYSYLMGAEPNLSCPRDIDKFTESPANGNGDLDYPVGLLTIDEIRLAGGGMEENSTYYLYTGQNYWAGSPVGIGNDDAFESGVWADGDLGIGNVILEDGVRPSVSLKPGFTIVAGGTGTTSNPYVVG